MRFLEWKTKVDLGQTMRGDEPIWACRHGAGPDGRCLPRPSRRVRPPLQTGAFETSAPFEVASCGHLVRQTAPAMSPGALRVTPSAVEIGAAACRQAKWSGRDGMATATG